MRLPAELRERLWGKVSGKLGIRRLNPLTILAVAAILATVSLATGLGTGLERTLSSASMSLRAHPASGDIVIVEVDAESLRRLNHWPWPRSYFATAIDRLSALGARTIAFDIDFSSRSTPAEDARMAGALHRAGGGVILPTFRQRSSDGQASWIDSLPIEPFRTASFLAAVNVFPDEDGLVRTYPLAVSTAGVARPSIAAMLVDNDQGGERSFAIDYAVQPGSIPRISFADLVEGRVDAGAIRGKRVLVGATAIELGDRYAVPRHGVVPGVVIQAVAAETLQRGGAPAKISPFIALILVGAALLLSAKRTRGRARLMIAGITALLAMLASLVANAAGMQLEIAPSLIMIAGVIGLELTAALSAELHRRRFEDRATGMANAAALELAIESGEEVQISVARFDRFHQTLAALGDQAGIMLMRKVEERIALMVRTQVYLAGDGALAWTSDTAHTDEELEDHFASMIAILRQPFEVSGTRINIRPTFGISTGRSYNTGGLVAGAMAAAQRAYAEGSRWARFVEDDGEEHKRQIALLGELSDALASGAIWVAYQPKFGLRENQIIGAEALVRWRHPTRGAISPDSFIPLIEAEGRALELTEFVLDQALRDLATWTAGSADVSVAVNISATLLQERSLPNAVAAAIARNQINPARLTLELTESAIIQDSENALRALHELRALGVRLSIDDYGTGQSTLSYLREVPASELKIDKSFIQNLTENGNDRLLVRSTIDLAHALGMKVVAEGVEDAQCLSLLHDLDCDTVQGWHTGRPMASAEFYERVEGFCLAA